jgi:error-prone DNA polymerase
MSMLPRLRPRKFYDLVIVVAIVRPGPIQGDMVHPYLRRRNGEEPVVYPNEAMRKVLQKTLGVPLFQEQLLRMAMAVAGFTAGEAEELRRAMGFKRSVERMKSIDRRMRDGMAAHGITGKTADDIALAITSFALYGFPESHAASFALIAYASAYLKAHHPAAFCCALMNAWPMGFYPPATLVKDAQRHGVTVLPVDVTRSAWSCVIEDGAVRLGLRWVAGLRKDAGERLVAARPITSVAEAAQRGELKRNEVEALAHAGAFAAFGLGRRDALWQASAVERDGTSLLARARPRSTTSPLPPMTAWDETVADYGATTITAGPHVMTYLRGELDARGVVPAADLARLSNGRTVRVAGHVIVRQRPGTAKGMCFLTLEDETGTANAFLTPPLFERWRVVLNTSSLIEVEGTLEQRQNVTHVRALRLRRLQAPRGMPKGHNYG